MTYQDCLDKDSLQFFGKQVPIGVYYSYRIILLFTVFSEIDLSIFLFFNKAEGTLILLVNLVRVFDGLCFSFTSGLPFFLSPFFSFLQRFVFIFCLNFVCNLYLINLPSLFVRNISNNNTIYLYHISISLDIFVQISYSVKVYYSTLIDILYILYLIGI